MGGNGMLRRESGVPTPAIFYCLPPPLLFYGGRHSRGQLQFPGRGTLVQQFLNG